jgi:hypothetical protein
MNFFIFVHFDLFGGAFWGRGWVATSPKRDRNNIHPPNARSGAVWGTLWRCSKHSDFIAHDKANTKTLFYCFLNSHTTHAANP